MSKNTDQVDKAINDLLNAIGVAWEAAGNAAAIMAVRAPDDERLEFLQHLNRWRLSDLAQEAGDKLIRDNA